MACYNPRTAYYTHYVDKFTGQKIFKNPKTGKRLVTHNEAEGDVQFHYPCGQCIGCRLARSRHWAARCYHESSMHDKNCFITLTFDPSLVDEIRRVTLIREDIQKFIKRLRRHFCTDKISYFGCGEYGKDLNNPHYHLILFGIDFEDKKYFKKSFKGHPVYISETLASLWKFGFHQIGSVTYESAAYCARYCTKKFTGKNSEEYYGGREPEFAMMSLKPAIGLRWLEKYCSDIYPSDEMVIMGKVSRPPRYYDKFYEKHCPESFDDVKLQREFVAFERQDLYDFKTETLRRWKHKLLTMKSLPRILEVQDSCDKFNNELKTISLLEERL